jgi:hypothetical protein
MTCKGSGVVITLCLPSVGVPSGCRGSVFGLKMPLCFGRRIVPATTISPFQLPGQERRLPSAATRSRRQRRGGSPCGDAGSAYARPILPGLALRPV